MGENIGAAARIMYNFGFSDLRIVSPRDGWPNEKAVTMSAGGKHIIAKAEIFDSLQDSMYDIESAYAVSARKRDMVKDVFSPEQIITSIKQKNHTKKAFVFGQENSGLTNKDISLCNAIITIPVNPDYPSLNLAQAVSILCYEYSKNNFENGNNANLKKATRKEVSCFVDNLVEELGKRDFYKSVDMKPTMIINLTNIFSRISLTKQELSSLIGIIKCLKDN